MDPNFDSDQDALNTQQLQADRVRQDAKQKADMEAAIKAKRLKWGITGVIVFLSGAILWGPAKTLLGKIDAGNILPGNTTAEAPSTTTPPVPAFDVTTATPEEIVAYANRKREQEQAAAIAKRKVEAKRKAALIGSEPPPGTTSNRVEWLTVNLKELSAKQKQDYNLLNDRIAGKQFEAQTLNGAVDYELLAEELMPVLVQHILSTEEGKLWLREYIKHDVAFYVKRDIEKQHKGHGRN